jgi:hypothetical protein
MARRFRCASILASAACRSAINSLSTPRHDARRPPRRYSIDVRSSNSRSSETLFQNFIAVSLLDGRESIVHRNGQPLPSISHFNLRCPAARCRLRK